MGQLANFAATSVRFFTYDIRRCRVEKGRPAAPYLVVMSLAMESCRPHPLLEPRPSLSATAPRAAAQLSHWRA